MLYLCTYIVLNSVHVEKAAPNPPQLLFATPSFNSNNNKLKSNLKKGREKERGAHKRMCWERKLCGVLCSRIFTHKALHARHFIHTMYFFRGDIIGIVLFHTQHIHARVLTMYYTYYVHDCADCCVLSHNNTFFSYLNLYFK